METKNCQNCKNDFIIDSDDFDFYKKIDVPPPTFCPECRMVRRMMWRNHRSFYRRVCEVCQKNLLSVYPESGACVMCSECWNGDKWDQHQHAKDIDWDKPFLSQVNDLFQLQPRVFQYRLGTNINAEYANSVINSKNIYLSFSIISSEDVSYSENVDNCKNSLDSLYSSALDQCSWNIDSSGNYNCQFVIQSQKNIDSYFLYDCSNCQNCCLSSNLRNKSYIFRNEQLSRDAYMEKVRELKLETWVGFEKARNDFDDLKKSSIHRFAQNLMSVNVTGDHIRNSKEVKCSFDVGDVENVSSSYRVVSSKDLHDCCWVLTGELEYETISGTDNSSNQIGCVVCFASRDMRYSLFCRGSSNCFGCVGLKNAQYCILNKQYTKEEYETLVPAIIESMKNLPHKDSQERTYTYGDFYPFEFSPFGYNETLAHDNFPLTEVEAKEKGYNWKEREKREYKTTINSADLPDSINDVGDSILNEIIACPNEGNQMYQCTTAFKIVPNELQFYRQKKLPLPRYCPNCRHYQRLKYRNPMHLYARTCTCDLSNHDHEGKCPNQFQTTYAPDRPEKVYCETCYQQEVI